MEQISVDLIPRGLKPVANVSQDDDGRVLRLNLYENGASYTLDGSEDLELNILKPDGTTDTVTLPSTSGDHVDLTITSSMSDTPGANYAKLRINSIGTSGFILNVEIKP